MYIDLNLL